MAMMALEESQDCNSAARGWAEISFFVCFLYAFKAAANIVSKFVEEVEADGTGDMMVLVGFLDLDAKAQAQMIRSITVWGTGALADGDASCLFYRRAADRSFSVSPLIKLPFFFLLSPHSLL